MLMVAVVCNSLLRVYLLPRLAGHSTHAMFRGWIWVDEKLALYGWVPVAIALLAWDIFVWRESRPKVKGWFTRKLLTFALVAGVTPFIPHWFPAGQPPENFLSMVRSHPGLPAALAWCVVVVVVGALCINSETRDSLLGHGKVLSLISLGVLLMLLAMTIASLSIA